MRLGGFKYVSPIRYMGTKLIANAIRGCFGKKRPSVPRILDLTRHQVRKLDPARGSPVSAEPVRRVETLAEWRPVFDHAPNRPAAVKRNGGLRGSTATRWT